MPPPSAAPTQLPFAFAAGWADSAEERARRTGLFDSLLTAKATSGTAAGRGAWTNRAIARRLGVDESLVRWWRDGRRPVRDATVEALGLGAEWRAGLAGGVAQ